MTNSNVRALVVVGSTVFAGTFGNGVWKRPISEITPITPRASSGSTTFSLSPTPFIKPSQNIEFHIEKKSLTKLSLFHSKGKKVETLVNEILPSGKHLISFKSIETPQGIYFLRLEAGGRSEARKVFIENL